ncbi:MAG: hypothetical protein WAX07_01910 [Candidatus Altiarchaeia archaeon]
MDSIKSRLAELPYLTNLVNEDWILDDKRDKHLIKSFLKGLPPDSTKLLNLHLDKCKLPREEGADSIDLEMKKFLLMIDEVDCHTEYLLLNHLENCLRILGIKSGTEGSKRLRSKLTSPNQFFDTLSEIEVAAVLKKSGYCVILEPDITGKTPDLSAFIAGGLVYLEVYTPNWRMDVEEEKVHSEGFSSYKLKPPEKDVLGQKLIEKYAKNIAEIIKKREKNDKNPVVVVINTGYSHFDKEYAPDKALHGTPVLNFFLDNQTGECIRKYGTRKLDSIAFTEPSTENISAVIAYTRDFTIPDCRPVLLGRVHKNHYCERNILNENQIKTLKTVFNDSVVSDTTSIE